MDTISFKRHRFPPEIIRCAVWLYARFTLSYRDVEDLLAERGLDISYESVRRWFLKLGAPIARNLRHTRPIPNGYWHLDERVIVIRGQRYWFIGAGSTMKARSWISSCNRSGTPKPYCVEVDAQAAEETRLDTHPDHNR